MGEPTEEEGGTRAGSSSLSWGGLPPLSFPSWLQELLLCVWQATGALGEGCWAVVLGWRGQTGLAPVLPGTLGSTLTLRSSRTEAVSEGPRTPQHPHMTLMSEFTQQTCLEGLLCAQLWTQTWLRQGSCHLGVEGFKRPALGD